MFGKHFELLRNGNIRMQVFSTQFYDYIAQVTDLCKIRDLLTLAIFKPRKALFFLAVLLFSAKLPNGMFLDSRTSPKVLCPPNAAGRKIQKLLNITEKK